MHLIVNQTKCSQIKEVNFTIRSPKSWLQDNDIEIYSTHIKGNIYGKPGIIKGNMLLLKDLLKL